MFCLFGFLFFRVTKIGEPRQVVFTVEEYSKRSLSGEGRKGQKAEGPWRYLYQEERLKKGYCHFVGYFRISE